MQFIIKNHLHCSQLIHNILKFIQMIRNWVTFFKQHINKLFNWEDFVCSISLDMWWKTLSSNHCLIFPIVFLYNFFQTSSSIFLGLAFSHLPHVQISPYDRKCLLFSISKYLPKTKYSHMVINNYTNVLGIHFKIYDFF